MINVTKTFLPPLAEYMAHVERAFNNGWLTNRGQLVLELEDKLKQYLDISGDLLITNNGTIPLQIALKLLGKGGEVITTPFSYVATVSSIVWENCTPVFVDIHPDYLTIDETKIEAAITEKTTCILATHVFGNPCHVEAIEGIAARYGLKVIYDAAHCFGVKYNGKSIFDYGDLSTCSFHATKLFHTAEGGAIFCRNTALFHQVYYSHNFGHNGPLQFHGLGVNAKISELQAAMGLAILPHLSDILQGRKTSVDYYNQFLDFGKLSTLRLRKGVSWNYSYYPVIFESESALLQTESVMNSAGIMPRRYFYPSLNHLPYVEQVQMSNSESISSRILCLPLYADLEQTQLDKIVSIVNANA